MASAERDLESAIALYREALATATASGKVDGGDIGNLANALIARYQARSGEVTSTRPYRFTTRQCERRPRTLPNGSGR